MSIANVNVVVISGNLTRDPELRHTGGGTPVCKMRVAVNARRKNGQTGEWVDKPNFLDVVVWGKFGETCAEHLGKGRKVTVNGRLDWREWEDQAGNKRQAVEIIADGVEWGPKPQGSGSASPESTTANNGQLETAAKAEDADQPETAAETNGEKAEEDIPF
jgi:single-strand DNA-binding protein